MVKLYIFRQRWECLKENRAYCSLGASSLNKDFCHLLFHVFRPYQFFKLPLLPNRRKDEKYSIFSGLTSLRDNKISIIKPFLPEVIHKLDRIYLRLCKSRDYSL